MLEGPPALVGGGLAAGALAPDTVSDSRWGTVFALFASAWVVAALAWLGINAARPIVQEPDPATTTGPQDGIREVK